MIEKLCKRTFYVEYWISKSKLHASSINSDWPSLDYHRKKKILIDPELIICHMVTLATDAFQLTNIWTNFNLGKK